MHSLKLAMLAVVMLVAGFDRENEQPHTHEEPIEMIADSRDE